MPEDPNNQVGRHLDPDALAKAVAQQLAASKPKKKRRPARKLKDEKPRDYGSQPVTPLMGRLLSMATVIGLCFGIGVAIAATVVWATGSLPVDAAEVTTIPTVTFPGQVTTTTPVPPTTDAPGTTLPADTTSTTQTTLPAETTTTEAATTTTGGGTPPPPPPPPTSTTSTTTSTTTTIPSPSGSITCNGGTCGGTYVGSVTLAYSCQNASTCRGEWNVGSGWVAFPGNPQGSGLLGPMSVRVVANGTVVVAGPFSFAIEPVPDPGD